MTTNRPTAETVARWRTVRGLWLEWHDQQLRALETGDDRLYQIACAQLDALEAAERAARFLHDVPTAGTSRPRLPWIRESRS